MPLELFPSFKNKQKIIKVQATEAQGTQLKSCLLSHYLKQDTLLQETKGFSHRGEKNTEFHETV